MRLRVGNALRISIHSPTPAGTRFSELCARCRFFTVVGVIGLSRSVVVVLTDKLSVVPRKARDVGIGVKPLEIRQCYPVGETV